MTFWIFSGSWMLKLNESFKMHHLLHSFSFLISYNVPSFIVCVCAFQSVSASSFTLYLSFFQHVFSPNFWRRRRNKFLYWSISVSFFFVSFDFVSWNFIRSYHLWSTNMGRGELLPRIQLQCWNCNTKKKINSFTRWILVFSLLQLSYLWIPFQLVR